MNADFLLFVLLASGLMVIISMGYCLTIEVEISILMHGKIRVITSLLTLLVMVYWDHFYPFKHLSVMVFIVMYRCIYEAKH